MRWKTVRTYGKILATPLPRRILLNPRALISFHKFTASVPENGNNQLLLALWSNYIKLECNLVYTLLFITFLTPHIIAYILHKKISVWLVILNDDPIVSKKLIELRFQLIKKGKKIRKGYNT